MDVDLYSKAIGYDVSSREKNRKLTKAKRCVWTRLCRSGYSFDEIADVFGYSRQNVSKGVYRFEDELSRGDRKAKEYWAKVKHIKG